MTRSGTPSQVAASSKPSWWPLIAIVTIGVLWIWGDDLWILAKQPPIARDPEGKPFYQYLGEQHAINVCYDLGNRRMVKTDGDRYCCAPRTTSHIIVMNCDLPRD